MKTRFAVIGLVISLWLAPALVLAQEPPTVKLSAEAGLDGYYRVGQWLPVRAQLQNMQGDDVDAALLSVVKQGTSADVETLLAAFRDHSPRFRYDLVDPSRELGKVREYGVTVDHTVVVEAQGRRRIAELESERAERVAQQAQLAQAEEGLVRAREELEDLRSENDFLNGEVARYHQKNQDLAAQVEALKES